MRITSSQDLSVDTLLCFESLVHLVNYICDKLLHMREREETYYLIPPKGERSAPVIGFAIKVASRNSRSKIRERHTND